ncbi:MAG: alpha/beta hydrolase [Akkermansiaceae bacterium]|nr:alpha/beta hydrolase [Akkermansiaceae bacterium]
MKILHLLLLSALLSSCKDNPPADQSNTEKHTDPQVDTTIEELRSHLSLAPNQQPALDQQAFASNSLTKIQAEEALNLILANRTLTLRADRQSEFENKSITINYNGSEKTLKYEYKTFGDKPSDGHSLYISMHGGGGAPPQVNDGQWKNQINLYQPAEGIYLAPRAPTDTWDLWHQDHIDPLFDRLIENFIAIEGINPNKVYIMGYSAGGDGTYQLAPRMADRWAGAAMMAGHPGDAQTYNLRNLPYFIQCGGKDAAYNRNQLAAEWGSKLDQLAKDDPGGYPHKCIVYPQYGHWMNLECKQAVPWMAKHTRNPWPKFLHWHQDNVTHTRFFWLANPSPKPNQLITAKVDGQTITIYQAQNTPKAAISPFKGKGDYAPLPTITLRLSDQLVDLDKPLTVKDSQGKTLFQGMVNRTVSSIHQSIQQRPDPTSACTATLTLTLTLQ